MRKVWFTLLTIWSVTSCKVGPSYQSPHVVDDALTWKNQTATDTAFVVNQNLLEVKTIDVKNGLGTNGQWWKIFQDDTLNDLIDKAFLNSPTLNSAAYRIMESRQVINVAKSNYFPVITFDPNINRNQLSPNRPSQVSTGNLPGLTLTTISIPVDMSYEADVWGKFRRGVESAKAAMTATEADYYVIRLALSADIATNYFMLRLIDSQIKLYSDALTLRKDNLKLTRDQYNAGIITQLDVNQAISEVGFVETQLIDSKRTRALSENAIAILCGIPTMQLKISPRPEMPPVPIIPLEVPSDLLHHRPDIVQAEQQVIGANAQIGVARAAYFPSVKLSAASIGWLSSKPENIFDAQSQTYNFGVGISLPLFTGGRNAAQKAAAEARLKEVEANYRQVVLSAFREVQDAMVNIQYRSQQSDVQQNVLASMHTTSVMSKELYKSGLTTYINVILADRAVLDAENSLILITGQRILNSISLIKALGGGWDGRFEAIEKKK